MIAASVNWLTINTSSFNSFKLADIMLLSPSKILKLNIDLNIFFTFLSESLLSAHKKMTIPCDIDEYCFLPIKTLALLTL